MIRYSSRNQSENPEYVIALSPTVLFLLINAMLFHTLQDSRRPKHGQNGLFF